MAISISPQKLGEPSRDRLISPIAPVSAINTLLFWISFTLLIAVFLVWMLLITVETRTQNKIVTEQEKLAEKQKSRSVELESELLAVVARAEHVEALLDQHRDGEQALRFLEERVQPGVVFGSVTIDYDRPSLSMAVSAPDFSAIARQIVALEEDSRIVRVEVGALSRSAFNVETPGAGAVFSLSFTKDAFLIEKGR